MTALCYPVSHAVAHNMIQKVVRTICDRSGLTGEHRKAQEQEIESSVMAFGPRDPVEIMLAGMVVTNYHIVMHSASRAFDEQVAVPSGRITSGIVSLQRATTVLLKEIRIARARPLADVEEAPSAAAPVTPEPGRQPRREMEPSATSASPAAGPGPDLSRENARSDEMAPAEAVLADMSKKLREAGVPRVINRLTNPAPPRWPEDGPQARASPGTELARGKPG
jgi:hypothetical protein